MVKSRLRGRGEATSGLAGAAGGRWLPELVTTGFLRPEKSEAERATRLTRERINRNILVLLTYTEHGGRGGCLISGGHRGSALVAGRAAGPGGLPCTVMDFPYPFWSVILSSLPRQ